jgi:hypothetical protein
MEKMLGLVIENPLAAGAGAVGMLCFAAYPAFRRRALLLVTYLGNNLGFAMHYALLGEWTAATMNMGLGVQTVAALGLERRPPALGVLRVDPGAAGGDGNDVAWLVIASCCDGDGVLHPRPRAAP